MAQQDLKEFKDAVREIAIRTTNLECPYGGRVHKNE